MARNEKKQGRKKEKKGGERERSTSFPQPNGRIWLREKKNLESLLHFFPWHNKQECQ